MTSFLSKNWNLSPEDCFYSMLQRRCVIKDWYNGLINTLYFFKVACSHFMELGKYSSNCHLNLPVLQGLLVSPILFLLYTFQSDIPKDQSNELALFANENLNSLFDVLKNFLFIRHAYDLSSYGGTSIAHVVQKMEILNVWKHQDMPMHALMLSYLAHLKFTRFVGT